MNCAFDATQIQLDMCPTQINYKHTQVAFDNNQIESIGINLSPFVYYC